MRSALLRFLLTISLLLLLGGCRPPIPPAIADEMAQTPKGTATIVFFTDFQCPFCRRTHAALAPLVADRKREVRVVLRHVPLPRHPDARSAARAAICAESLSPDPLAYAHALSRAADLSEPACADLAVEQGMDRARFERCTRDPATEQRIERDIADYRAASGDGVPLLFIGRTRLDGAQTRATLEPAIDEAIAEAR